MLIWREHFGLWKYQRKYKQWLCCKAEETCYTIYHKVLKKKRISTLLIIHETQKTVESVDILRISSVTSCTMCFFHRCPVEHVCSTFPTWQHRRLNSQITWFAEGLSFAITYHKMITENILTSTTRSSYLTMYIFHIYIYIYIK